MNEMGKSFHQETTDTNECIQFERRLDRYLDGRQGVESLSSDGHLKSCQKCQIALDVYRQFSDRGGAVLNGGGRWDAQMSSSDSAQRSQQTATGLPKFSVSASSVFAFSVLATAALLMLIAMSLPFAGDPTSSTSVAIPTLHSNQPISGQQSPINFEPPMDGGGFELATGAVLANADRLAKGLAASEHSNRSPVTPIAAIGHVGGQWWQYRYRYRLPRPLNGFQSPLFYTSELPGIRPLHRSMNVAMVAFPLDRLIAVQ